VTIQARPTIYKGHQMRSRLEASYAAECDYLGVTWEYEPMCFADQSGQYLPDFAVNYGGISGEWYVEVKAPHVDHLAALARMHIIRQSEPGARLSVVAQMAGQGHGLPFSVTAKCEPNEPCRACAPDRGQAVLGGRARR
jgi:hypothetical protein